MHPALYLLTAQAWVWLSRRHEHFKFWCQGQSDFNFARSLGWESYMNWDGCQEGCKFALFQSTINWDGFPELNFNFRPHACKKIFGPFIRVWKAVPWALFIERTVRGERERGEAQMGAVMSVEEKWLHGAEMHGDSREELELGGFVFLGIENWFFFSSSSLISDLMHARSP